MKRGWMWGGLALASGGSLAALVACGTSSAVDPAVSPVAEPDAGEADGGLGGAWPREAPDAALPEAGSPVFGPEDAGAPPPPVHCTGKTGPGGDTTMTLTSSGLLRDALVHVPPSYDATTGAMLVLNFHGFMSNAPEEIILTQMNPAADARDFIVVYPDGVASSWNAGTCCGTAWNDSVDDVAFTKDLLAELGAQYCIDPARVYATGMSNGGFFAHRLGCEMAGVFAAIAPVAGVLGIPPAQCLPSRPMPVLDFHGTADPLVPYDGGSAASGLGGSAIVFASVAETIATWRTRDDCTAPPSTIYSTGDATCLEYGGCAGGAVVDQCTIAGGGHTWPGGVPVPFLGATSTSISATNTMIDFFVAHPMPAGSL